MLVACDDFLSGVATLAEADAVQEIEIQHLRDEGLARAQIYLRQTGGNVGEAPVGFELIRSQDLAVQSVLRQFPGSTNDPVAARVVVDAGHTDAVLLGVALGPW